MFDEALESLAELHRDAGEVVTKADWAQLAKALGQERYWPAAVAKLFYPKADEPSEYSDEEALKLDQGRPRRRAFLSGFGDTAYYWIYDRLCNRLYDGSRLCFPDVEGLLKTKKEDGQVMKRVMQHVISWVNATPIEVSYSSESNKPLCREDLKPALRRTYDAEMSDDDGEERAEAE